MILYIQGDRDLPVVLQSYMKTNIPGCNLCNKINIDRK